MATCLRVQPLKSALWGSNYEEGRTKKPLITVTLQAVWDVKVPKSPPKPFTTIVPQGTVLKAILSKAAATDSAYAFTSWYFPGLGEVITSIDDVYQNNNEQMCWTVFEDSEKLILTDIDTFQPKHGSNITFAYVDIKDWSRDVTNFC